MTSSLLDPSGSPDSASMLDHPILLTAASIALFRDVKGTTKSQKIPDLAPYQE